MKIEIREACGSDAEEMISYNKRVGSETDFLSFGENTFNIGIEKESRFLERFKKSGKDLMLVALDGEKIVANASIEGNKIARYSHTAELSITVLRDYWGQGIGTALMERMLSFSASNGYRSIHLEVRADNERAIALYLKFGFKEIGVYNDYFNVNGKFYDAKLMILYL